jgi:type III secretory pathway component EscS
MYVIVKFVVGLFISILAASSGWYKKNENQAVKDDGQTPAGASCSGLLLSVNQAVTCIERTTACCDFESGQV